MRDEVGFLWLLGYSSLEMWNVKVTVIVLCIISRCAVTFSLCLLRSEAVCDKLGDLLIVFRWHNDDFLCHWVHLVWRRNKMDHPYVLNDCWPL